MNENEKIVSDLVDGKKMAELMSLTDAFVDSFELLFKKAIKYSGYDLEVVHINAFCFGEAEGKITVNFDYNVKSNSKTSRRTGADAVMIPDGDIGWTVEPCWR